MSLPVNVQAFKQALQQQRDALRQAYLAEQLAPHALLTQLSAGVDALMREVWYALSISPSCNLLAVGGYGRGELYPASDVDILILLPDGVALAEDELQKIEQFIGAMWDIGLELGHSVRTFAECLDEASKDITVQTTLLEMRLLVGDAQRFSRLAEAAHQQLDCKDFFDAKLLEQQQRHARFQGSASKLEANTKESPGGLRDLHTVLWITKACQVGGDWRSLLKIGMLSVQEVRLLLRSERVLQNLRIALHYQAKRREDRLLFEYQTQIALQLGFLDQGHKRASEQMMQTYYRAARITSQLNSLLLDSLRQYIYSPIPSSPQDLDNDFYLQNNQICMRHPQVFAQNPSAILKLFLWLQQERGIQSIQAATQRALWQARVLLNRDFRKSNAHRQLFMQILRQPRGVTRVLRRMNQFGILGRYLPAFGKIVGQMQHDLFHVYTVDEHILMVLRNLRRFSVDSFTHEYPLCSRLIREFERPEVLYVAALFHDIAKGRGGDHSELGMADARQFCQEHQLSEDDTRLIEWLVQQHLMMSAVAQKQDVYDPQVVEKFAKTVGDTRHLIALYLLTVADIRGTSPQVWNTWKAKLLEDLYHAANRYLAGENFAPESYIECRQRTARAILRLNTLSEGIEQALWKNLDSVYFLQHNKEEIAWHARVLYPHVGTTTPIVRTRVAEGAGQGIQVLIYSQDQADIFARICQFFERTQFNIVEAKVYTTRHGYVLDSFYIMQEEVHQGHQRDHLAYIEHELSAALQVQTPLQPVAQGRISRHVKHFPLNPEVDIRYEEKPNVYTLSIIAGDRPGLLSQIAAILVQHQIRIHSAKITTLGARAEDVFVISGGNLAEEKAEVRLEQILLQALRT